MCSAGKKRSKLIFLPILFSFAVTGCETIAPERAAAESLMGKDIQEAYATFGKPWLVGTETRVGPASKLYGHKFYFFQNRGISYDRQKLVGSYMDTSSGHLQHVEQYQTEHVQEACNIGFWADPKTNIIDYYQVKGNCGWGGLGLGQTW
ncbi:hypothetical protein [Herbaspirillum rubrisubalbicans]|uniref:hypothetical protein n=1 Tax=Herbaspirillum rubrisubalbicans TaxID=80842 RepID=UPI0011BE1A31|nr:hypothetical protein [Herbaspirillum rubrisubalbicans]MCP1575375.1 hypothetical protein [Herbaspirillum rubrisubalbicans]